MFYRLLTKNVGDQGRPLTTVVVLSDMVPREKSLSDKSLTFRTTLIVELFWVSRVSRSVTGEIEVVIGGVV